MRHPKSLMRSAVRHGAKTGATPGLSQLPRAGCPWTGSISACRRKSRPSAAEKLAGAVLTARFAPNPSIDPKTKNPIRLTWDNHR